MAGRVSKEVIRAPRVKTWSICKASGAKPEGHVHANPVRFAGVKPASAIGRRERDQAVAFRSPAITTGVESDTARETMSAT
jgi:hypothetical protein